MRKLVMLGLVGAAVFTVAIAYVASAHKPKDVVGTQAKITLAQAVPDDEEEDEDLQDDQGDQDNEEGIQDDQGSEGDEGDQDDEEDRSQESTTPTVLVGQRL